MPGSLSVMSPQPEQRGITIRTATGLPGQQVNSEQLICKPPRHWKSSLHLNHGAIKSAPNHHIGDTPIHDNPIMKKPRFQARFRATQASIACRSDCYEALSVGSRCSSFVSSNVHFFISSFSSSIVNGGFCLCNIEWQFGQTGRKS